ncbi:zinc finger (Ran-binding) family protein [Artemisia annua]|uniref:Zinc finger (Ran-binding) family protein n=1 Tax=Artemisia annua TaxID=35608 RepID=A0A2U1Q0C2_ARTAN|nr:zinc finger (Ran-binding) family protein [Artemisia annua]
MTGISSRLLSHLTKPTPFLRLLRRHQTLTTVTRHRASLFPTSFKTFTTRATTSNDHYYNSFDRNSYISGSGDGWHVPNEATWPEWIRLLECLYGGGYFNRNVEEDEFVGSESLGVEFVNAARACLAFAQDRPDILRWLSRKDIEVVINDVYPYLFRSADETERRMKTFLQAEGSNEATSVDLMKYILNFVNNPIVQPERSIKENTESSVRSLLYEMANLASRGRAPEQYEQMPRNLGPNITMKRGDWICPKCSFMNFARNTKCLECEESRPQRQLADGEWDCPRCNFFNYRKNLVCFKCAFNRPDVVSPTYAPNTQTQDTVKEDKTERWFQKVKELHGVTGPTNASSRDEAPPVMPMRREDNRFIDNRQKDRPFSPYQRQNAMEQGSISSFVPFVPFPPDTKKNDQQQSKSTDTTVKPTYNATPGNNPVQGTGNQQMNSNNMNSALSLGNRTLYSGNTNTDSSNNEFRRNEPRPETSHLSQQTPENMNVRSGWTGKSLEGSAVTETDPLDMSEEAKAERWFKRVAQIKDISELSQIPDEDFPSIMPMRKGVNRFVVSKRKTPLERRLTSPQYRKNLRIMSSDPMKREGHDDN